MKYKRMLGLVLILGMCACTTERHLNVATAEELLKDTSVETVASNDSYRLQYDEYNKEY